MYLDYDKYLHHFIPNIITHVIKLGNNIIIFVTSYRSNFAKMKRKKRFIYLF